MSQQPVKSAKNILLVEDDSMIRMTFSLALQLEDYTVFEAVNGKDALDFLAAPPCQIGLILLDSMMPIMDGFAFRAEQIKNEKLLAIPTILYSANHSNELRAQALGVPFFKKPFDLPIIYDMVKKYFLSENSS